MIKTELAVDFRFTEAPDVEAAPPTIVVDLADLILEAARERLDTQPGQMSVPFREPPCPGSEARETSRMRGILGTFFSAWQR